MYPKSKYRFEDIRWWLNGKRLLLACPASETGTVQLFVDGDRKVLMPGNKPVRPLWLVEIDGFDDKMVLPGIFTDDPFEGISKNQVGGLRKLLQKPSYCKQIVCSSEQGPRGCCYPDTVEKSIYFMVREDIR